MSYTEAGQTSNCKTINDRSAQNEILSRVFETLKHRKEDDGLPSDFSVE